MAVNNPFNTSRFGSNSFTRLFLKDEELQIGLATILEVAAKLKSVFDSNSELYNISWAEMKVLLAIGAKKDTVLNLASRLAITKQSLTKILNSLEYKNLIDKIDDSRDKRRKILTLTFNGKKTLEAASENMRAILAKSYRVAGHEAVFGADQVLWAILGENYSAHKIQKDNITK